MSLSSGRYRVQLRFLRLRDLERKEVLSDISTFTQSKLVCSGGGIRFVFSTSPINVTGFVQSLNSNNDTAELTNDRIIESVILQRRNSNGNWVTDNTYTTTIKNSRNDWLQAQIRPRTEYSIWGYVTPGTNIPTGTLQSGFSIRLGSEVFRIKEITYESETMHSLKSFEAICIK
jgi:hypothetical protein